MKIRVGSSCHSSNNSSYAEEEFEKTLLKAASIRPMNCSSYIKLPDFDFKASVFRLFLFSYLTNLKRVDMKSFVAILLLVSAVYGIPVQETPEVAAARAAHNAAHATARALNALPPVASPVFLQQPVQDTPEVWAAKAEHYRAYATAAAANGVVASLPSLQPYYFQAIPDTPEVWAAKQEFFRAYNAAAARG